MLILTIRTDKPDAEIGLFDDQKQLNYEIWPAHRQLAETIHLKIHELLNGQTKDWNDIQGLVCFRGPGSFTGLRIGLSVGNSLASSLNIPIVARNEDNWIKVGITDLKAGKNDNTAQPEYGGQVHTTLPRK